MSDEELVEEAADAIRWAWESGGWRDMARAALAVFKKAHGATDDERTEMFEHAESIVSSPWYEAEKRKWQAEALREAANAWTQGKWSDAIPPRDAIRPQIILSVAQSAGDYLRAEADRIEKGEHE